MKLCEIILFQVSVTYSKDGLLRFGDHITLVNKKTEGLLGTIKNILKKLFFLLFITFSM